MTKVFFDISVSLDGYIAGPDPRPEEPLGTGGEQLHEWATKLETFEEKHGREGGSTGTDDDVLREAFDRTGSVVMGRGMFGGGPGPWDDEPWEGWWGDEPPFGGQVFVLTHHEREPLEKTGTTFHFVTDGIESAVAQAREAAGEKDVSVAGGAQTDQRALAAGLIDEFEIHVVPVLLGGGVRLFDNLEGLDQRFEKARVIDSPGVTHMRYRRA